LLQFRPQCKESSPCLLICMQIHGTLLASTNSTILIQPRLALQILVDFYDEIRGTAYPLKELALEVCSNTPPD
jgi:hypothetical protein